MASQDYARNQMAADRKLRRSILAFRWLLLALWIGLIATGILAVSGVAFLVSASIIGAYNVYHSWAEVRMSATGVFSERVATAVRYIDIVTISVAMVALHDVRNPIWAIYLITIVGAAHVLSAREMAPYVLWTVINYYVFAAITVGLDHSVAWPYVVVVSICIALMGINASILAGSEQRLRDVIRVAATTDSLTGLPNRHHFHERYSDNMEKALKANKPLAVMLIDVDHFKDINDQYGHPAGDDKLRDVAGALQSVMRGGDMVARYGGDEFIVIAPGATRAEGVMMAERLTQAARAAGASVSIGVAMFPEDSDAQAALIEAADGALYRAKQDGRNCVRTLAAA